MRGSQVRRTLVLLMFSCCWLLHVTGSAAQTWREVDSPHFHVVTDGSERDGRDVAKEFEQMRSVFTVRFKNVNLETGAPLLIVAVREPGLHALSPWLWKDRDRVAGEFFKHWERQYALVRLDSFGDLNQTVIFHEYTHSVLHANVHWLPTWLDEGMAEFYAYTRIQGDHIYVGGPSVRMRDLQTGSLIPISEMMGSKHSLTKDQRWTEHFYAEAWAMVHFMTFGPGMENGAKLDRFIKLLDSGTAQTEAFQQVFGDPKKFEDQLSLYVVRLTVSAYVLPPSPGPDPKSFPVKVLTPAEVNYELGSFDIGVSDMASGRTRLEAAEGVDPALAGPHEELGFLLWREGKDEAARAEWKKAVEADASSYRAAFALLMSGKPLKQQSMQELVATQQALQALSAKAPKFAPVIVELALVEWRLGQINEAFKAALVAEKLEPWRAGYHLLLGDILLAGKQPKLAADYARLVATRWPGADHDEAIDLLNAVPEAARGDVPVAASPGAYPDATVVRGTIVSSSCEKVGDKGVLNVELQPNTPQAPVLKVASAGGFESGFSDTLWMGEDHYTTCFHLAGLPAVVGYKATGSGPPRLVMFEVRDDLPGAANAPSPTQPAESREQR